MSVGLCGFSEVSGLGTASEGDAWLACVDVSPMGLPASATREGLFGEGRWPVARPARPGIAHRRGLPATRGCPTRQQAGKAPERQQRVHGSRGGAYLDYPEIRRLNRAGHPADAHPTTVDGPRARGLLFGLLDALALHCPSVRLAGWLGHVS